MPKQLPPEIIELQKTYYNAQLRLIDIIAKTEAKGNVTRYRKELLASINAELKALNLFTTEWVKDNIPDYYNKGTDTAYQAFRNANIDIGTVAVNQKAIKLLVDNAIGQLTDATLFVGRRLADTIRQAGLEAIAEKLSVGATVRETKANLIKKLMDRGVTAIRDKSGREIKLESYASTVVHCSMSFVARLSRAVVVSAYVTPYI